MGTANWKSVGKSWSALGRNTLYDWRIVASATPAMSPISTGRTDSFHSLEPDEEEWKQTFFGLLVFGRLRRHEDGSSCDGDRTSPEKNQDKIYGARAENSNVYFGVELSYPPHKSRSWAFFAINVAARWILFDNPRFEQNRDYKYGNKKGISNTSCEK